MRHLSPSIELLRACAVRLESTKQVSSETKRIENQRHPTANSHSLCLHYIIAFVGTSVMLSRLSDTGSFAPRTQDRGRPRTTRTPDLEQRMQLSSQVFLNEIIFSHNFNPRIDLFYRLESYIHETPKEFHCPSKMKVPVFRSHDIDTLIVVSRNVVYVIFI
ncbi:hypothetical protein C0J52_21984 [Blattella germanica]|nr:hypothetical protein C0J52_21984 [Blattella germanica]